MYIVTAQFKIKLLVYVAQQDRQAIPGPEVINLEFTIELKIKRNDWLLADTCPQAANHCAVF